MDALIGLPLDVIDARQSASEQISAFGSVSNWIPRWPALTVEERVHETAFADTVQTFLRDAVDGFCELAMDAKLGCHVFEVDAAKRLYHPYETDLRVRAVANHALHPAGVAIARLAFLEILDRLAKLPSGDPRRSVFVTNGGCAAGKGNLVEMVRSLRDGAFDFGAVWDAAGEGDAQENAWILEAIRHRSLSVVFGFVENNPLQTYEAVLDRALATGRIVDPLTFTRSYVRGQENMRAFLASAAYRGAATDGYADAIGIHAGPWTSAADPYPRRRALGSSGRITAEDVPAAPDERTVFLRALDILGTWLARQGPGRRKDWAAGSVVNMLKF